jgi:integrase
MLELGVRPVSGHIYRQSRRSGARWVAKWRDAGGQHKRVLARVWTGKGRPPDGYLTKRGAQQILDTVLADARRGELVASARMGVPFREAAEEWLRHAEHERDVKPSTFVDYRSVVSARLLPAFGDARLEAITTAAIDRWRRRMLADKRLSPRTVNKSLTILHGIMERARRVWNLPANPVADVERARERYSGDFDFFSPEEVRALVRAAASEQDGAMYLTAAFAGLRRGELVALRWRDVDFEGEAIRVRASFSHRQVVTPKGGKVRTVPMVPEVAQALARLSARDRFTGDRDLVFPNAVGRHIDASALRRRYVRALAAAELRPLRFHDLRHTFGSLAINRASIVQVHAWMGHADIDTTMRYLHHKSRADEARLLAEAFKSEELEEPALAEVASTD